MSAKPPDCKHWKESDKTPRGGGVCLIGKHQDPSFGTCAACLSGKIQPTWDGKAIDPSLVTIAAKPRPAQVEPVPRDQWGLTARIVTRFAIESDKGLGDVIQRHAAMVGGEWFKAAMQMLGVKCGCDDRQKWLNLRYPLPWR
jgi:hypothetical protein